MTLDDTVRDIVAADFRAAQVFHRHGINFCCAGGLTLGQACRGRDLREEDVLAEIGRACAEPDAATPRFATWQPETLVAYIVGHHHAYVRAALPGIAAHTQKLAAAHGDSRPELHDVAAIVEALVAEMTSHMSKEENILFPYIVALADAIRRRDDLPDAPFGRIDSPIRMMEAEHEAAGAAMEEIRELCGGFTPPEDACLTYRVCLRELEAFERDLHVHVHLENNVLFPKARALAAQAGR